VSEMSTTDAIMWAERSRADALTRCDVQALTHWLHDDLVYIHATGARHDRAGFARFVETGPRFLAVDLMAPTVDLLSGDTALLTGELHMRLQRSADAELVAARSWASAVWLRGLAGWQLRLFQSTRVAPTHG
jgi:ketosteroid isomerase-like protein